MQCNPVFQCICSQTHKPGNLQITQILGQKVVLIGRGYCPACSGIGFSKLQNIIDRVDGYKSKGAYGGGGL